SAPGLCCRADIHPLERIYVYRHQFNCRCFVRCYRPAGSEGVNRPGMKAFRVSDSVRAKRSESAHQAILSVRDLRTQFSTRAGVVHAWRGVSFDINAKERLVIVGERGGGKSTLALSILSLIKPPGKIVGGEVWLNGREISRLSDRRLQASRG